MANQINAFRNYSDGTQNVIEGNTYNGIVQGLTFASGETEKYLLLEIPEGLTIQFLGQGLTLTPYDDTFQIRLLEGITTLTTGTPIIVRNMNRNFAGLEQATWTTAPVGIYGGEGIIIEDFNPFERRRDYLRASKTVKDDVERIFHADDKYLFKFTRTTDTNVLTIEYRFIWVENI